LLRREERYAAILRGAAAAFARSGFAVTSMDDVAAACGVSRLILYRHFGGKEELYRAILERVFARMGEELEAGLANPSRGLGARTMLTVAREDPDAFVLLWRHAAREPRFADYAQHQRELAVGAVREIGGLRSGDEMFDRWAAETMFSYLVEATLTWLAVGDPARDDELIERATAGLAAMRNAWP
jgi:AcrR family transcriptional regulator